MNRKTTRRTFVTLLCPGLITNGLFQSVAYGQTSESVLLKVHGTTGGTPYSLDDLDALPQQSFATGTVWTTGVKTFSGPALADVLVASGSDGGALRLQAANDYSVILPPTMIEASVPIIVTRIDGKTFGLRESGPLWLMFPYDSDDQYQSESIYAASIWQLTDIFSEAPG